MRKKSICIIIPAYNEEASLPYVISSLKKLNLESDLIVINDGSQDNTGNIAEESGANTIHLPDNIGTAAAILRGIRLARKKKYEIAVEIDADGQHDPRLIPALIASLDNSDIVVGSRFLKKSSYKTPIFRYLAIIYIRFMIRFLFKISISDPTSGFRAYNKKVIDFLAEENSKSLLEPVSIVKLIRNNFKIQEISVEMKRRYAGNSSLTILKGIYLVFLIIFLLVSESLRQEKM